MASISPPACAKTPKFSNLSGSSSQIQLGSSARKKRSEWGRSSSLMQNSSSVASEKSEMTYPFTKKRVSYEDVMDGMDDLERSLTARSNFEKGFNERLSSLAGDSIDSISYASSSSSLGPTTTARVLRQDLSAEELKRRLKAANKRVSAKSDAFDLIYKQWQAVQKELEQKKLEVQALEVRSEAAERRESLLQACLDSTKEELCQRDDLIDELQFKLFWAESEIEESKEREAERIRKEAEELQAPSSVVAEKESGFFVEFDPRAIESDSDFLADFDESILLGNKENDLVPFDEAKGTGKSPMLPRRVARSCMPVLPSSNKSKRFGGPKKVQSENAFDSNPKGEKPLKKGLLSSFYKKSKKRNGKKISNAEESSSQSTNMFSRALSSKNSLAN